MGLGGAIILLGSVSWMRRVPGDAGDIAPMAAQQGLAKTLAQERARPGIRVNALVPGIVDVPRPQTGMDGAAERAILDAQAVNYRLKPEDLAAMALFLASDDARACTGQTFVVGGGIV